MDPTIYPLQSFAVCLGAGARARNKAKLNAYKRADQERVSDAMGKISTTKSKQVSYEIAKNEAGLDLSKVYASRDTAMAKQSDEIVQRDQARFIKYLAGSTGEKLAASGVTGRSARRISSIELGQYLAAGSQDVNKFTKSAYAAKLKVEDARNKAKNYQDKLFADVMNVDIFQRPPEKPVYENVAMAALTEGLGIASSIVGMFPS